MKSEWLGNLSLGAPSFAAGNIGVGFTQVQLEFFATAIPLFICVLLAQILALTLISNMHPILYRMENPDQAHPGYHPAAS